MPLLVDTAELADGLRKRGGVFGTSTGGGLVSVRKCGGVFGAAAGGGLLRVLRALDSEAAQFIDDLRTGGTGELPNEAPF